MTDIAYNVVSRRKKGVPFIQIWQEIIKIKGLDESAQQKKIAEFYTELMLDKRFISLADNKWDLRSRHTFDESKMESFELDDDDDDDFEEESEEIEESND